MKPGALRDFAKVLGIEESEFRDGGYFELSAIIIHDDCVRVFYGEDVKPLIQNICGIATKIPDDVTH